MNAKAYCGDCHKGIAEPTTDGVLVCGACGSYVCSDCAKKLEEVRLCARCSDAFDGVGELDL